MKQKTAIMELIDMLEADAKEYELDNVTIYSIINAYKKEAIQLLKKEKEQIVNAFDAMGYPSDFTDAEQYYNETYKQD